MKVDEFLGGAFLGFVAGALLMGMFYDNLVKIPTIEINNTIEHNNTITDIIFVNITNTKEVYVYYCNDSTDDLNKKTAYTIHGGWKPELNNSFWEK